VKYFDWDSLKNARLKDERGVSFEEVLTALEEGRLLDDQKHPNEDKYHHQKVFVVEINSYAYLIPYVEDETKIFLKTIIPSRKATKEYLKGNKR
jgi:uncharacterized DUF497 family protein